MKTFFLKNDMNIFCICKIIIIDRYYIFCVSLIDFFNSKYISSLI